MCKQMKSNPSRRNSSGKWPELRESSAGSRACKNVRMAGMQSTWGRVVGDEAAEE